MVLKPGDFSEERLGHKEQAEQFYQDLRTRGLTVRAGMEASGMRAGSCGC